MSSDDDFHEPTTEPCPRPRHPFCAESKPPLPLRSPVHPLDLRP